MFKIVFFDLDGTLLTTDKKVLEENKRAIKNARENGIEVCICSGRQQGAVRYYQKMAGAGRYIIDANGAEIYDTQDEEQLYACGLDTDYCMELYRWVLENNLFIRIDTKYGRYINDMKNVVLDEMPMEEDYKKFFEENIILQMSIGSEDSSKIDEVVEMLDGRVKKENRFMSSLIPQELDMINIINSSASKGNAILGLCKYLKIKPEEAMAFGDDLNDISMMKSVYGVAMENASDNVKVLAKEITKTNDESGIAEILNRIVEENKNA
jgi:hypothetical protein